MRRAVSEEDQLALDAIGVLEATEQAHDVAVLQRVRRGRATSSLTRDRWLDYLWLHGVVVAKRGPDPRGTWPQEAAVPRWANDLLGAVVTAGDLDAQRAALRLVQRAVRSAARSALFRARLSAEAARLRVEVGVTFGSGAHLLRWLRTRDWSDTRPGSPVTPETTPKTLLGGDDGKRREAP